MSKYINLITSVYGYDKPTAPYFDARIIDTPIKIQGLIITIKSNKYIICIRDEIINCTSFKAYTFNINKQQLILHELEILLNLPELSLLLFVTKNNDKFDEKLGEVIYNNDNIDNELIPLALGCCSDDNLPNIIITNDEGKSSQFSNFNLDYDKINLQLPKSKTKLFLCKSIFDEKLEADNYKTEYKIINYSVKFNSFEIERMSYITPQAQIIIQSNDIIDDISGCLLIDNDDNIYGLAKKHVYMRSNGDNVITNFIKVIPSRSIYRICNDLLINDTNSFGIVHIPIMCKIINNQCVVDKSTTLKSKNKTIELFKGDIIIKVNNLDISIVNNEVMVFDSLWNIKIDIEIYFQFNIYNNQTIDVEIIRNKIYEIDYIVYPTLYNNMFQLNHTHHEFYKPHIGYYDVNNYRFCYMSHELLQEFISRKIYINNDFTNDFNKNLLKNGDHIILLLDTKKNKNSSQNTDICLKPINIGFEGDVYRYIVEKVNNKPIKHITDIVSGATIQLKYNKNIKTIVV